jgi:2-dehydrotetronate isomerase
MPRFAANLTWLFTELPFLDRFGAARRAGFDAVEVLFPYDSPAPEILDRLAQNDLRLVLINCPPPNYAEGPRGFAAIPGGEERFRYDFKRALRYSKALGARHLHLMAGVADGAAARASFVDNLRWAAAHAPGQSLTIEPINSVDMPGYFMSDFDTALGVIAEVEAPNLHLQFDAYHAHRITGDVMGTWDRVRGHVAHVQVAGFPGRSEPIGGIIDYPAFFARLDADRYEGWVSGEYKPAGRTEDGLRWMG